jgi:hypothetical protein
MVVTALRYVVENRMGMMGNVDRGFRQIDSRAGKVQARDTEETLFVIFARGIWSVLRSEMPVGEALTVIESQWS